MRTTTNPFLIALGLLAFFAIPLILITTAIVALISGAFAYAAIAIGLVAILVAQERSALARNFPKKKHQKHESDPDN